MDPANPFGVFDDMMSRACDAAFGIAARVEPYTSSGAYGDGRPDTDRVAHDLIGGAVIGPAVEPIGGPGSGSFGGPGRVSGQSVVFGVSAAHVRAMAWEIQPGDRLVLLNAQPPYPTRYRIARLSPNDMGDLELILNEANEG